MFETTVAIQITVKARCRNAARGGGARGVEAVRRSGEDVLPLVTFAADHVR
jgi:hypothetical protein